MVVAKEQRNDRYEGRAEVYEWVELAGGAEETIPQDSLSRNRSKGNRKCNHSSARGGEDKNLRSGEDVKFLPHEGPL